MKRILAVLVLASLSPLAAMAGDGGGSDGCGLGWQITQKKSFLATTTRGTTNVTIPPTFGMTTGTIGCDAHSFAVKERASVEMVVTNYDALKVEMAVGSGETLAALARTMGCSDASMNAFGAMTQKNYSSIVGNNSLEMYENVRAQVKGDAALSNACAI